MRSPTRTILIIGGGFCGATLATQLLLSAARQPTHVIVVEPREQLGRGLAYAKALFPHLLNVPSQRMSADGDDELQFARFAREHADALAAERFLPRELYGQYLQQRLQAAASTAASPLSFTHLRAQADAIYRIERHGPYLVSLSDGQRLLAERVIVACGDPPAADPRCAAHIAQHHAYVRNPFGDGALQADTAQLLLIGTGLTMADVALAAAALNPRITIHAISRHGLLPAVQSCAVKREFRDSFLDYLPEGALSARTLLRAARTMLGEVHSRGCDWRDGITSVREVAPALWQRLALTERARFLRHLRTHWDVHRHRMPPLSAERLYELQRRGQLQVHAGRLQSFEPQRTGTLTAYWRPRGQHSAAPLRTLTVQRVINCAGTDHRLCGTREPLLRSLLDQGLASVDALGLGLLTTTEGALIGADGHADPHLQYVGPMLRASLWEATAVGELRTQIKRVAASILHAAA